MRVRVYVFSLDLSRFLDSLKNEPAKLLNRTEELLMQQGINAKECRETLECIEECIQGAAESKTGILELLHAICWFLEANGQKTEIEAFQGWKIRYFEDFGLSEFACSPNPYWLPTSSEAAPSAFLVNQGTELKHAIHALEEREFPEQFEEEFEEAKDEMIEVLTSINKQYEDAIIISLVT
jgi:hypothetical protein